MAKKGVVKRALSGLGFVVHKVLYVNTGKGYGIVLWY